MIQYKIKYFICLIIVVLFNNILISQADFNQFNSDKDSLVTNIVNFDSVDQNISNEANLFGKLNYDSSDISVRSIDSTIIKSYLKDKDFNYFEDPEATKTLWEKLMEWIGNLFQKLFSFEVFNPAWDVIEWLLIALAIISIIFVLLKSDVRGWFFSSTKKNRIAVTESLENIHTIDYEKMIEDAVQNGNYRYAIRLNYLRTLKKLSDKEFIIWRIDKTNHEFVKEIQQNKIKKYFENITLNFETIWYGCYFIDKTEYSELQKSFLEFITLLETAQ